MDIDYAIRKDEPPDVADTSNAADIALYERWERSNRLSMMFIKTRISAGIRGYQLVFVVLSISMKRSKTC